MKQRLYKLTKGYALIFAAGLLYALLFSEFNIKIPCIFNTITGYLCPACGISRMCVSILKFEFIEAFYYNRLVFLLIPLFCFFIVKWSYDYVKKGKITKSKTEKIILWTVIVLLVIFGIVRNII